MDIEKINYLQRLHFITSEQRGRIASVYSDEVFSLHSELRSLTYIGVLLLVAGLSTLAYNNLNTVGHQLIILMLFAIMSACFCVVIRGGSPYSHSVVQSPGNVHDSILLLGSLLVFLIVGYVQYQYILFDDEWEFIGLIPVLVCIPFAYRYDHRGVLALGIVGFAAALGLTASPVSLMKRGFFATSELVYIGLAFGALLVVVGLAFHNSNIKKHFTGIYIHFAAHCLCVACISGMVMNEHRMTFVFVLLLLCAFAVVYAKYLRSFSVLLITFLYGYIGMTYMVSRIVSDPSVQSMYIVISGAAVITALFALKRQLTT